MTEPTLLLDTDILIEILRGEPKAREWLRAHEYDIVGISVVVQMEILQGARDKREQHLLIRQLQNYQTVHLEREDSIRALKWFRAFRLSHNIGIMDCWIAATAVRLNLPLYSFNIKHYRPISALNVQIPYRR